MKEAGISPFPFHDLKARASRTIEKNWAGHRATFVRPMCVIYRRCLRLGKEMPETAQLLGGIFSVFPEVKP